MRQRVIVEAGQEHVNATYKGLPLWRTAAWLFLHFSGIPVALMLGWYTLAFYHITGRMYPQELSITLTFVFYVIAVVVWKLARPATSIESLTMTKVTNLCVLAALALKCVHICKYHVTDLKQHLLPRRLWKYMSEEEGYTSPHWLPFFTFIEALGDGGVVVCLGLTMVCFHNYISGKVLIADRLKRAREAGDTAKVEALKKEGDTWEEEDIRKSLPASGSRTGARRGRGRA